MKPEVHNVSPQKDRVTTIGNMHIKFGKDCTCGSGGYPRGQTDTHTDVLITILRNHSRGRSNDHS